MKGSLLPQSERASARQATTIYGLSGQSPFLVMTGIYMDISAGWSQVIEKYTALCARTDKRLLDRALTSELVYLSKNPNDVYGEEYQRRMTECLGLSPEQCFAFYRAEKEVLNKGADERLDEGRKEMWFGRRLIFKGITPENLYDPENMTVSELAMITEEAEHLQHDELDIGEEEELGEPACEASIRVSNYHGRPYARALWQRISSMFGEEAADAFKSNEGLLCRYWGERDSAWKSKVYLEIAQDELRKERLRERRIPASQMN